MTSIERVRRYAWHYLDPGVAAAAAMSLAQLQQFVAGVFSPSDAQLQQLSRRMGLDE